MSLGPLWQAGLAVQVHALAAILAFGLGAAQLSLPMGTLPHRLMDWLWVSTMAVASITAFWIHELRVWGPWSPIHILAIITLASLPGAVYAARSRRVRVHSRTMITLFLLALVITGFFTLLPGRIMHQVLLG